MKLTHNLKSGVSPKSFHPLGSSSKIYETAQPSTLPGATSISNGGFNFGTPSQKPSKQIENTTSSFTMPQGYSNSAREASKLGNYDNALVYSQINERINQFSNVLHHNEDEAFSTSKNNGSIKQLNAHKASPYMDPTSQGLLSYKSQSLPVSSPSSKHLDSLRQQLLSQLNEKLAQHRIQSSNSLRQAIIKLDENVKRECFNLFSRQFLGLEFLQQVQSRFGEMSSKVNDVDMRISCLQQNIQQCQKCVISLSDCSSSSAKIQKLQHSFQSHTIRLQSLQQLYGQVQQHLHTKLDQINTNNGKYEQQILQQIKIIKQDIANVGQDAKNNRQQQNAIALQVDNIKQMVSNIQTNSKNNKQNMNKMNKMGEINKYEQEIGKLKQMVEFVKNDQQCAMSRLTKLQHNTKKSLEQLTSSISSPLSAKPPVSSLTANNSIISNSLNNNTSNDNNSKGTLVHLGKHSTSIQLKPSISISLQNQKLYQVLQNQSIQDRENSVYRSGKSLSYSIQSMDNIAILSPKAKQQAKQANRKPESSKLLHMISSSSNTVAGSLKDIKSNKYIIDNDNLLMDQSGNYILDGEGQHIRLNSQQISMLKQSNIVKYKEYHNK